MTSDEFDARYELQDQLTTQGVRSFVARRHGRPGSVLVHFLDGGQTPENQRLLWLINRLPAADHAKFIENVPVDRSRVIVTEQLAAFESLEKWLESRVNYVVVTGSFRTQRAEPAAAVATQAPEPAGDPSPADTAAERDTDDAESSTSLGEPMEEFSELELEPPPARAEPAPPLEEPPTVPPPAPHYSPQPTAHSASQPLSPPIIATRTEPTSAPSGPSLTKADSMNNGLLMALAVLGVTAVALLVYLLLR